MKAAEYSLLPDLSEGMENALRAASAVSRTRTIRRQLSDIETDSLPAPESPLPITESGE